MKTDTPETDEATRTTDWFSGEPMVPQEFARKLEHERNAAREALSGRTVSCSHCNETAKQLDAMRDELQKVGQQRDAWAMRCDKLGVEAMREAIKEAYEALIEAADYFRIDGRSVALNLPLTPAAIAKLQPFIKP